MKQTISATCLSAFLLIVFAAGCASQKTFQGKYDESEYEPYKRPGTATIHGQAFLKTRGGDVKYAAGNEVVLVPRTSYSRALIRARVDESTKLFPSGVNGDKRLESYERRTIADGSGNFEFTGIPAGDYSLQSNITWQFNGQFGVQTTGGYVRKDFTVVDGTDMKIVLTR